jgi:hypothetical protein
MLPQTSEDATTSILRELATCEPGWHLGLSLAWQLGGDIYDDRSLVLRELGRLHKQGILERIHVWDKDRPKPVYWIDPSKLLALAEDAEQ